MLIKCFYGLAVLIVISILHDIDTGATLMTIVDTLFLLAVACLIWAAHELERLDAEIKTFHK